MSMTTSARAVILPGQTFVNVDICLPECQKGEFMVQGVHVGPEVAIGNTAADVVHLPRWAVTVPVYQSHAGGAVQVALTAQSPGAEHVSATLPAGQGTSGAGIHSIPVTITLLGGVAATHRFEFNVHVTGVCGVPFICHPPKP
jgi:hypothetical protein